MTLQRIVPSLLLASALAGCAELDLTNPNQQTTDTFWKSSVDATQGINATYNALMNNGAYGRWLAFAYDIRSDIGFSPRSAFCVSVTVGVPSIIFARSAAASLRAIAALLRARIAPVASSYEVTTWCWLCSRVTPNVHSVYDVTVRRRTRSPRKGKPGTTP